MAGKIKHGDFKVMREADFATVKATEMQVTNFEQPIQSVVSEYEPEKIKRAGEGNYDFVKAKYGALAATDSERQARSQRDRRFSLNPMLRTPLSVEQEERRVIEEKVRTRIVAMADEAKAAAAKEGYKAGLEKGYSEAFARFREEGKGRLASLETLFGELEGAKDEIFRANERFLVDLAFKVAKTVLLRELKTDREYVMRLAREIVERVGVRENISIKLHPEDMTSVGMLKEGLEKSLGALKNVNVEPSNQIKQGGCIVGTEWNVIDASIENQLQGIEEALIGEAGGAKRAVGGPGGPGSEGKA